MKCDCSNSWRIIASHIILLKYYIDRLKIGLQNIARLLNLPTFVDSLIGITIGYSLYLYLTTDMSGLRLLLVTVVALIASSTGMRTQKRWPHIYRHPRTHTHPLFQLWDAGNVKMPDLQGIVSRWGDHSFAESRKKCAKRRSGFHQVGVSPPRFVPAVKNNMPAETITSR